MVCRIDSVAEVRAWLDDLRAPDPGAAGLVDQAVTMLAEKGTALGPPLVVPIESVWDLRQAVDEWYQQQLQRLQNIRRGVADAATARQRADLQVTEVEASMATLDERLHHPASHGDQGQAARLRVDLAHQRQRLAEMRQQQTELARRENELESAAHRATTDTDLFRIRKEAVKIKYTATQAKITLAEVEQWLEPSPAGAEQAAGDSTATRASPTFLELRPARLGEREIRILLAMQCPETAVLLYADDTRQRGPHLVQPGHPSRPGPLPDTHP